MKNRIFVLSIFVFLGSWLLVPGSGSARPERVELKSDEVERREARAEALAKRIDLAKVNDPDARLALEVILNSLDLDYKKAGAEESPLDASAQAGEYWETRDVV